MKVIGIVAQKGGAGKTTLALHLAVLARGAVLDLDPQSSASAWKSVRTAEEPVVLSGTAALLGPTIEAARKDALPFLFVDTAPHDDATARAVARASDFILIPCRPGFLDLRAIGATVALVKETGTPAAIVLNACPPPRDEGEPELTRVAREVAGSYGLLVAPPAVAQRAALAHALSVGEAVQEFEPEGKAAAELKELWSWIRRQLR